MQNEKLIQTAYLIVSRLERLSADSFWAHRASGLRGSLLRCLDDVESRSHASDDAGQAYLYLQRLVDQGYFILENGAREIRVPEL